MGEGVRRGGRGVRVLTLLLFHSISFSLLHLTAFPPSYPSLFPFYSLFLSPSLTHSPVLADGKVRGPRVGAFGHEVQAVVKHIKLPQMTSNRKEEDLLVNEDELVGAKIFGGVGEPEWGGGKRGRGEGW